MKREKAIGKHELVQILRAIVLNADKGDDGESQYQQVERGLIQKARVAVWRFDHGKGA